MKLGVAIAQKYVALQEKVELLPKLGEECDLADICVLVTTFFSEHHKKDYRPAIRTLATMRGISPSEEMINGVYPEIEAFLNWIIPHLKAQL